MEKQNKFHYIPGQAVQAINPLDRYLPPYRHGVVNHWLKKNLTKGGYLLDPFGASPDLAIDVAKNGYGIIVAANNPIIRFILEMRCNPPDRADFQAAIANLASTQISGERLEPHIKSLYETLCDECGENIQVNAYLWKRDEEVPFAKVYTCPKCGTAGEYPTRLADKDKAVSFSQNVLHKTRALEKVTPLHDPDRHHVQEALEVYLPRSIYALVTIMNKLGGFHQEEKYHRILNALMLLAFDRSNTLWLYPKERQRPKQLTIPPQFREHNIWLALESAIDLWTSSDVRIPLSIYPELPPENGGICIFKGRIKELADALPKLDIKAIVTSFPRPNQAFWTLSALWSGWLWGHEALEHYKGVLRRRRYDWGWHATAINTALRGLVANLGEAVPFFGTIDELEPGFLSAVIIGSLLPDFHLEGIAMRQEDGQAQLVWHYKKGGNDTKADISSVEQVITHSSKTYLEEDRGEPSPYIYLHAAGLKSIAHHAYLAKDLSSSDYLSKVQSCFSQTLTYRNGFVRFGGSGKSIEAGDWWIRNYKGTILPLSDQVEMALVKTLIQHPNTTLDEMDERICETTPGLAPPEIELIQVCLDSYGSPDSSAPEKWSLQDGDLPEKRRGDIREMLEMIQDFGKRLGYQAISNEDPLIRVDWIGESGKKDYTFYISASAVLGKYLWDSEAEGKKSIIVVPGSRANLVAYKKKSNPYLSQVLNYGWEIIKYRHIRQLSERSNLHRNNFDEQLSLDPLTYTKPQIRLL